ncbi:MAG: protein phosphatase 2C domain-containing protein [Terracidiphilus sp.]|jgi:serine/threonine protein phosphatase PrpC
MSDSAVLGKPTILFAEECDRGKMRQVNQDSILHVSIPMGELLIVSDGIGGENAAGVSASKTVVEQIHSYLAKLPQNYAADSAIREAAAQANAKILPDKEPDVPQLRMGAAVIVALVQQEAEGSYAWIGHVGDCRAYLVRAGRLHRLTFDHSGVQSLLNRNLITPEEVYRHPDTGVLTRALGVEPEVEIDIEKHPLAVGDTLLLCSDGLWDAVSEKEIERTASGPTVETAARDLLQRALDAGGRDNIGIEMARLNETRDIPHKSNVQGTLLKWILVVFVLAVVGLGALTYLTFFAN